MRQINNLELKKIQMGILKYFISICTSNKIDYFLAYGTMLGAVRHKGYIPWDDDIDVMVFRKDVEKLINCFDDEKYKIINSSVNKKYFSPLLKVYDDETLVIQKYNQKEGMNIGVYIDVFVLDKVPKNDSERKTFYLDAYKLRFKWALSCSTFFSKSRNVWKWLIKRIMSIPYKIIGYHHYATRYENFAKSLSNRNDCLYGIVLYGEGFEKEYAYTPDQLRPLFMKFEDILVSVPIAYDDALHKCYGNYMELPPIEDRKTHPFIAFYK